MKLSIKGCIEREGGSYALRSYMIKEMSSLLQDYVKTASEGELKSEVEILQHGPKQSRFNIKIDDLEIMTITIHD